MCQQAFEDPKKAVIEESMLALPDHTKVFEVHTDASDFAIGGVFMQDRHPIAFENHKLNDTERQKTNNVATSYFQTQKKLSPKQARWQDFLAEFDYTLEYKLGNANHVVDALRRKAELASMMSQPQGDIIDHLREGLQHDPVAKSLIALAHEGKTKQFWVEDDLLYTKGRLLYVPKWGNIRRNLIKECHDTKWVGHPGQQRTRALLESAYYWPQIWNEVEAYVRTCLVC
ncbi:Transposon Ty3-G Gag-Pol polyprotein [Vitis vinifera]|uniref:Transposon Ty3-G Gag-Pol polyprotein n=1 Tax=Vitis vinifera TaxID=29760 RepID=A0A438FWL3_VITVI|nr:Transposon Ty3-G Gag-Pol polyprotein [Vitis vinifera]